MQAGGQEFESPHLHQHLENYIDKTTETKDREEKKKKQKAARKKKRRKKTGQETKGLGRMPRH